MKKQPEITDATRESFVRAFFQLAQTKNIHQITIQEITSLAGYNRTTFYRYFEDVYALIEYTEDTFLERAKQALAEQRENTESGEKQFFETIIQCFHENADYASILMSEQNRSHLMRRIKENVSNYLDKQNNDTPKERVIRDIYFYGIFHAISINLQNKDALPDEDLLELIQELFDYWYWPEMTRDV